MTDTIEQQPFHPASTPDYLPRAQLRRLQLQRMQSVVRLAYDHVDFVRDRMNASGVRPERIQSLADVARLPFTEKNDLNGKSVILFNTYGGHSRDNFPGVWMDRIVKGGGRVVDHLAVARIGRTDQEIEVEIYGLIASRSKRWLASCRPTAEPGE